MTAKTRTLIVESFVKNRTWQGLARAYEIAAAKDHAASKR